MSELWEAFKVPLLLVAFPISLFLVSLGVMMLTSTSTTSDLSSFTKWVWNQNGTAAPLALLPATTAATVSNDAVAEPSAASLAPLDANAAPATARGSVSGASTVSQSSQSSSASSSVASAHRYLVAITTCNQWHLTSAALDSLVTVADPIDIVIVDDKSEDDTVKLARQRGIHVVEVRPRRRARVLRPWCANSFVWVPCQARPRRGCVGAPVLLHPGPRCVM